MSETPKPRATKADRINILLSQLAQWQAEGLTGDALLDKLTPAQYDFLIDSDIDLDNIVLTKEQQKVVTELKRSPRPSGLQYKKKYPQDKQELYGNLLTFLQEQGATITPKERENYRDIDFDVNGIKYRIVLSNPRS